MDIADNSINYIELPVTDIDAAKAFYGGAFGWTFTDYGPTYASFAGAGIDGGLRLEDSVSGTGGALVVLYHADLEGCLATVAQHGGDITAPIFDFPGGRRFHFLDPAGNELAVWSAPSE